MPSRLDLPAYLLLLTGLLHLVGFGYVASRRNWNAVNASYAFLALALTAWNFGWAAFRTADPQATWATFFAQETFLAGFLASFTFLLFAIVYPYQLSSATAIRRLLLVADGLFGALISTYPGFLKIRVTAADGLNVQLVDLTWVTIYSALVAVNLLVALAQLFRKFSQSDGAYRAKLGAVAFTTGGISAVVLVFALLLPYYFGSFRWFWIAHLATLGLFGVVTYLIVDAHRKMKVSALQ